jgi:hypothetical protein
MYKMSGIVTAGGVPIEIGTDGADLVLNGVRVAAVDLLQVFDPTKPDLDRLFCKRSGQVYVTTGHLESDRRIPYKRAS